MAGGSDSEESSGLTSEDSTPRTPHSWRMTVHSGGRRRNRRYLGRSALEMLRTASSPSTTGKSDDLDLNADAESCSSSLRGLNFDSEPEEAKDSPRGLNTRSSRKKLHFAKEIESREGLKTPPEAPTDRREPPPRLGREKRPLGVDEESPSAKRARIVAPKARLSLFGAGAGGGISARSFYGGGATSRPPAEVERRASGAIRRVGSPKRRTPVGPRRRGGAHRRRRAGRGEINSGVRHAIRKPRLDARKKLSAAAKERLLAVAFDTIVENSPLNPYIEGLKEEKPSVVAAPLPRERLGEMDAILKLLKDKRPIGISPVNRHTTESRGTHGNKKTDTNKTYKIFKSRRQPVGFDSVQDDISELLQDDDDIHERPEKITIDSLLMQWPEEDIPVEEPQIMQQSEEVLKKIQDAEALLREPSVETFASELSRPLINIQPETGDCCFIPMDDDTNEESASTPCDLEKIESELKILDEKIAAMAKMNNIDPQIIFSSSNEEFTNSDVILLNDKENYTDGGELSMHSNQVETNHNASVKTPPKLFPLFARNGPRSKLKQIQDQNNKSPSVHPKKFHSNDSNQYIIDAGQKNLGAIQCKECDVIYQAGDAMDEADHYTHHMAADILKFKGWKSERFCGRWGEGRAIVVAPGDSPSHWQKVYNLLDRVVHPQLGYAAALSQEKSYKVYLYIEKKQIVGCLVAESLQRANKLLTRNDMDCCTTKYFPVKCGISRIWTHIAHRRKGIATNLTNAMRSNFLFGHILRCEEIAFSSPTPMGKTFAEKYTGVPDFNVYV